MFTLSAFLMVALKTGLLMTAAGLACALFARASAAHRHFVWVTALTLSLLLPLAGLMLPALPIVPALWAGAAPAAPALHIAAAHMAAPTPQVAQFVWPALLGLWAIGAAGLLLRDLIAHAGLMRWARRARPLAASRWATTFRVVQGHDKSLRVLQSPHVASPCTWGFLSPVLLLPAAGEAWTESQRRHALLHELAHVRRRDYLSALISRLACALHWYNPLVWVAAARARRLQEQACDDAVLRAGGTPSDYAQLLIDIAARSNGLPGPARAIGMAKKSSLHGRVVAILDASRARLEPGRLAAAFVIVPLSGVTLLLASASAVTPQAVKFESAYIWSVAAAPAACANLVVAAESAPVPACQKALPVAQHEAESAIVSRTDTADAASSEPEAKILPWQVADAGPSADTRTSVYITGGSVTISQETIEEARAAAVEAQEEARAEADEAAREASEAQAEARQDAREQAEEARQQAAEDAQDALEARAEAEADAREAAEEAKSAAPLPPMKPLEPLPPLAPIAPPAPVAPVAGAHVPPTPPTAPTAPAPPDMPAPPAPPEMPESDPTAPQGS